MLDETPLAPREYEMRFAAALVGAGVAPLYALDVAGRVPLGADPEADAADWLDAEV